MIINSFYAFKQVVIGWDIIRIEFWIVLGITVLACTINTWKYLKCIQEFNKKNWSYVVKQKKYFKHLGNYMFMLAVANFELYHDEEFVLYINKIKQPSLQGPKLSYTIKHLIITNNTATPRIDQLMEEMRSLKDKQPQEFFETNYLLYRIKFEGHVCSQEEIQILENLRSDRVRKEFLQ